MSKKFPRRTLLTAICGATVLPAATLWRAASAAAPAPLLDGTDPSAQALHYVPDAAKVDVKANPTFVAGSHCALCAQFQGKAGDKQGPCVLFPGKQVLATGWCLGYAKKPT